MTITATQLMVAAMIAAVAVWCINRLSPFGALVIMSLVMWLIVIGVMMAF